VTGVDAATLLVLTVKVALVAPAATVTLAGTVAAAVLSLIRETAAPPVGLARSASPCRLKETPSHAHWVERYRGKCGGTLRRYAE